MITEPSANLVNQMLAEKHGAQWATQWILEQIEKAKECDRN